MEYGAKEFSKEEIQTAKKYLKAYSAFFSHHESAN